MLDPLDRILPLPYPHFMAFAPLDAWWRLLTQDRAWRRIHPRYALRLAAALFTSCIGTAVTLPERLLLAPFLPTAHSPLPTAPGPVFILGYYRSGTTHLHYLLSCDPNLATPRWYQMLAPQGFALSWTFLRFFLVPFLSSKRPQDDVAYGSEYPAEDDFGLCNWSACGTMPGRMVLPGCWHYYSRFQTLDGLTERELARFRRTQLGLTWKLSNVARGRTLLLKSPAHTARLAELRRLYPNARFIHLHRDTTPVLRSNVAMHKRFAPFLLQPHPGDDEIRRRVIAEYDATERAFLRDAAGVPDTHLARVRYEDLIADPLGELRRCYTQLGLDWTQGFERAAANYLDSVRDYRAASERTTKDKSDTRDTVAPAPELEWMHKAFGHDHPPLPAPAPLPTSHISNLKSEIPFLTGPAAALIAAAFCIPCWLLVAHVFKDRMDWLAWPAGVLIGLAALRGAGAARKRGTTALGLLALSLTLAVILLTAYPATWLAVRERFSPERLAYHTWLATYRGVLATNNFLWILLGLATAYRFASRQHVRPPGL